MAATETTEPTTGPTTGPVTRPATPTNWQPDPEQPVSAAFRHTVGHRLSSFLHGQRPALAPMGDTVSVLLDRAVAATEGGKRLRPAFCVWGYVAAAGLPDRHHEQDSLLAAAASLDLLHVSALVHDDVMDASDTRRGRPAAHRSFEALHHEAGWAGDAAAFGRAGAILLGDLLLMWHSELLHRSGFAPTVLQRGLVLLEAMRTEVTAGQYLDMVLQSRPPGDTVTALADAELVTEFKSARYTVQRPLQFGAALAGGSAALADGLAAYASPLGRAFQYRDDLLGVFGEPEVTGKPSGDDLREGKRTALVAHARERLDPAGRAELQQGLGDPDLSPDRIGHLQQLIEDSGAVEAVESMITALAGDAEAALDRTEMTTEGRTALRALLAAAVVRTA